MLACLWLRQARATLAISLSLPKARLPGQLSLLTPLDELPVDPAHFIPIATPIVTPLNFALEFPSLYQPFYTKQLGRKCRICGRVPETPALCFLCGELVCFGNECCAQGAVHEGYRHAGRCARGTCIFLLLRETLTYICAGSRRTLSSSIFLDEHGEEDYMLRRGKPLFLDPIRLERLRRLWVWGRLLRDAKSSQDWPRDALRW
eukprot:GABV01001699.1.p1 GENE.GABV01001699.1~~GABV01001699.1.p1  ORF type:complete len:204 (-),score=25.03 GABV01001699.1:9-620(-)